MLDLRLWPILKIAGVGLLMIGSVVVSDTVRHRRDSANFLRMLADQGSELTQARLQLQQTTDLLASAEKKLGYLGQQKTAVQVTAFTGNGRFANGLRTAQSYAVPSHILPEGNILSIALSPIARRNLHAKMNDYILLLDPKQQKTRLAKFVDTTSSDELRPVVDIFFETEEQARIFGRQHFFAINISGGESPFLREIARK